MPKPKLTTFMVLKELYVTDSFQNIPEKEMLNKLPLNNVTELLLKLKNFLPMPKNNSNKLKWNLNPLTIELMKVPNKEIMNTPHGLL